MAIIRHLGGLQAFDAAATHKSVSRAAEALGVTHGAISRQLKQLEAYLGVTLLERTSRGVTKTDAGEQLHVSTGQAFSALSEGVNAVRRVQRSQSVSISLSTSLAIKWLVPKLPSFRKSHPGLQLFLDTNDELVNFEVADVDIALRFGVPEWENLHSERLVAEALVVVAAPSLVPGALPLHPAEIFRLPMLNDQFNSGWDDWAASIGFRADGLPPPAAEFTDSAVLASAALDGQGVALARYLLVSEDLACGRLVQLHKTTVPLKRGLHFVCRRGEENNATIKTVRDWLATAANSSVEVS